MNIKPTTSEMTIIHVGISALAASLIGALSLYIQYYTAHGQDLWVTLTFIGASFPVIFGGIRVAVLNAIRTSPSLKQAEQDLGQQALTEVRQLAQSVLPFVHQHPAPTPAQPAPQGRVSSAVTASTPRPITFPPASTAAHFGDTGVVPAVQQQ